MGKFKTLSNLKMVKCWKCLNSFIAITFNLIRGYGSYTGTYRSVFFLPSGVRKPTGSPPKNVEIFDLLSSVFLFLDPPTPTGVFCDT